MVDKPESGLRNHRIEYVDESTTGTAPSNPSWNLFSDTVRSFEWSPDTDVEAQRGLGDADPNAFYKGAETHELTVEYDLQQKTSSGNTLLDGSSNPNDAATDGIQRDSDQTLKSTHTVVDREDKTSITSEEAWSSSSHDTRIYTVGKGGYIDEVTLNGDPGSQNPVAVELSYQFEKIRSYQVDQPSSSTKLAVKSDDSGDTSQSLTVEDEGAGASESVSLSGTSLVSTTNSYGDIDALELDSETTGTVEVYVNTGSETTPSQGDKLSELPGSSAYNSTKGDLGIPALGSGSHASAIGQSYEIIVGDSVERPSGTNLAYDINSVSFNVSNNLETTERVDDIRMRIDVGEREATVDATVLGETESHTNILEHLQITENDVKWTLEGGSVQVDSAALTDPPSRTIEAGEAALSLDNTFTGKSVTLS